MEERARLKALEALFDPTTTARIVALPAGRGRDRSRGVAGQPVRPDDDLGELWLPPPRVRPYGHRRSGARDRRGQRPELRPRSSSQQNVSWSWDAASVQFTMMSNCKAKPRECR